MKYAIGNTEYEAADLRQRQREVMTPNGPTTAWDLLHNNIVIDTIVTPLPGVEEIE